ncbi:snapalysin family zinc-dependent metalloprotease [Streptomyces tardus]|uniref:snapalysin family zinc-dependent metalloprotease n=1 Tax=Streptomyces tardus TaxID=2780544 RepID=UPI0027E4A87B|nr:snapalysin family zinc-dependent metalloprotease [Streptomyces tardus]
MTTQNTLRAVAVLGATTLLALAGGQAFAGVAPTDSPEKAATVVTYDASGAEEFTEAVDGGADVWNESVTGVQLEPAEAGEQANITIVADDGWPRAQTTSLGNGRIWMGRQAVEEGHDTLRIASHELGHILGLPDIKPGPCTSLMSGASAGTDCTNAYPDESEKASVEDNFGTASYFKSDADFKRIPLTVGRVHQD